MLSVFISSYLFLGYLFVFAIPAGDQWRGEKQFAEMTLSLIGQHPEELVSFKTPPPVFYLGFPKPVPQYDSQQELVGAVRTGQFRWVILRRRDIPTLNIPAAETAIERTFPWDSTEHRANALVLMKLR